MANPEHLNILEQGVDHWNQWWSDRWDERPDLSGANLFVQDLAGIHLGGAILSSGYLGRPNLTRANLAGANLTGANLGEALLCEADLVGTNLTGAYLGGADLGQANLTRANLTEAHLGGQYKRMVNMTGPYRNMGILGGRDRIIVSLGGAILTGANLEGATLGGTVFGDVDLSQVHGLDQIRHDGPSTISIDTIYKSRGVIPHAFLRGCGVPDNFIEYMASLTGKAWEHYSCFISYSSKDEEIARRVHDSLQGQGVRCWFAHVDMKIGDKIRSRIDEAIRLHDKLLLILSRNSVESDWVEKEVETAFEQERLRKHTVLFPIRIDDTVMETQQAWAADIQRTRHIGDFRGWKDHDAYQKAFDRLLRDLKTDQGTTTG